jgi:ATP-dependent helicase HrpB
MSLPILEILEDVKGALREQNTVILQAPPGAGKSTVLPIHLLDEPWLAGRKILMLQPRRLAARAVASRLATLLGEPLGATAGYRVRFEREVSSKTRIEVLTEGILTRLLQGDNTLEGVGLVIFDEFHERSLHADLALALCREVQQVLRDDLRILVMSATLDGEKLAPLLGGAPVLTSQGRQYPIRYQYLPQESDAPIPQRVARAVRKALAEQEGDILAFLPGAGEIGRTQQLLEESAANVRIHPLYGDLPPRQQQEAILPGPPGVRKVVLATSIAETSLTIEGIRVVVDSGFARSPRFDPRTGLTRLETLQVTGDAADQRAGRAGRLGPGVCYRLWREGAQAHLVPHRTPEILEADLAPTVLELSQWGVKDLRGLAWLTPPPAGAVAQARELLGQLGALDGDRITERGRAMLRLPTHPRLAHLLLEGRRMKLAALAADLAALLEERDPLPREAGADLTLRVEALRNWREGGRGAGDRASLERTERLASAWRRMLELRTDNTHPAPTQVGRLLAAAYPERVARKRENHLTQYRLANGRPVRLPDHDPLAHETWLAVAHLDAGNNEGKIYLAAPLNPDDLRDRMDRHEVVDWDAAKGILVARTETRLGDILVESTPLARIDDDRRRAVLCRAMRTEGLKVLPWTEGVAEWQARVLSLRTWRPDEPWPDVSDQHLLGTVEEWLGPYLDPAVRRREDFGKLNLGSILPGLLPWPLAGRLDELAPATLKVPSGSQIRLQYFPEGSDPVLAVRLQEMFGLLHTPTVNEGRTRVLLHLLSPGYRPVQVTQDLKSFWENTYQVVRKELRVRYPKHAWPEDPWTAEAVRGVKRKG